MDARSMNQADAALLAHIAETIVEPEVMAPMEKAGWSEYSGEEQIPGVETTPTEGAVTPTEIQKPEVIADNPTIPAETSVGEEPEIDWESLRGTNGLILDKYKTKADAVKGVKHAVIMAKDAFTRNAELEAMIADMRKAPAVRTEPVLDPQPTSEKVPSGLLEEVLSRIAEEGGTLDDTNIKDLRDAFRETTKNVVEEALTGRETRISNENRKWNDVDVYMRQSYPDSINFTDEMGVFVASNRPLKLAVDSLMKEGNYQEATELAWVNYRANVDLVSLGAKRVEDTKKEIQLEAADQVRKEAVAQARVDAGVSTTVAGGVHESPKQRSNLDEIEAAAAEMRATGIGDKWRALVFGRDLKGPMFE